LDPGLKGGPWGKFCTWVWEIPRNRIFPGLVHPKGSNPKKRLLWKERFLIGSLLWVPNTTFFVYSGTFFTPQGKGVTPNWGKTPFWVWGNLAALFYTTVVFPNHPTFLYSCFRWGGTPTKGFFW